MAKQGIRFNSRQYARFVERSNRVFVPRISRERMSEVERRAKTATELEELAVMYGLCDHCDLKDLNVEFAHDLFDALVKVSYAYPKIRSKLNYVGSKKGFIDVLRLLAVCDTETVKRFSLDDVCDKEDLVDVAANGIFLIDKTDYDAKKNILAESFSLSGLIEALIVDEGDFGKFSYRKTAYALKRATDHPEGCDEPISIVYHELGHLLDYLCGVNGDPDFRRYYDGFLKAEIKSGLSVYAATNAYEFFAEAFSEYECSKHPREIARYVGEYIAEKYQRL